MVLKDACMSCTYIKKANGTIFLKVGQTYQSRQVLTPNVPYCLPELVSFPDILREESFPWMKNPVSSTNNYGRYSGFHYTIQIISGPGVTTSLDRYSGQCHGLWLANDNKN